MIAVFAILFPGHASRVIPQSVTYSFATLLLDLLSGNHIPSSHVGHFGDKFILEEPIERYS
ncbi:hypothetical protein AAZX31_19G006700 [Glycine max]